MDNYKCAQCGKDLKDARPVFRAEQTEDGRERIFRTVPELCDKCREKRFWASVKRLKEKPK